MAENMQNFKSNTVTVIELHVFMERKNEKKMANLWKPCLPVFHTLYGIFIQLFAAVIILRVFHFGVIKRQIELKLKVKTELSMAIMLNHPWQSLYMG